MLFNKVISIKDVCLKSITVFILITQHFNEEKRMCFKLGKSSKRAAED